VSNDLQMRSLHVFQHVPSLFKMDHPAPDIRLHLQQGLQLGVQQRDPPSFSVGLAALQSALGFMPHSLRSKGPVGRPRESKSKTDCIWCVLYIVYIYIYIIVSYHIILYIYILYIYYIYIIYIIYILYIYIIYIIYILYYIYILYII